MKRKLRGLRRGAEGLDFNLYRVRVPIRGLSNAYLSVIDLWPEGVERTLLFVHGYAGVAETWEYQLSHFARSFRVVAPDLRGHGQSDAPYTNYTMQELVDDIEAVHESLRLPERFILVGHSFGGSICVEYAAAHPGHLEKLVLISTAGEYPLPRITAWASRVPAAAFRPWWRFRPRWNAEVHVMKRMMLNNMRRWVGWPKLEGIRTPTLVITGERDRYFPRRVFQGVGERIAGAEIVDVGASKHKVQLERAGAVNRTIERFIADARPGPRPSWREQATARPDHSWLKAYDPHVPPTIPLPRQPLHRFLETTADWMPNRTATVFYGSRLTYQQLDRRANQFAHALHGLGVQPGDRVMLVLPNMPQTLVAYYGTLKVGGAVVLANPDANAEQIARQAELTQSKALVTLKEFAALAEVVRRKLGLQAILAEIREAVSGRAYRQLMARWQAAGIGGEAAGKATDFGLDMDRLLLDAPWEPPRVGVSSDDLAAVLYTSGTTDEPKGVRLTHANLIANLLQIRHWIPGVRTGREVFLSVIPLTHSYGMTTAMNLPIAIGGTMVLLSVFELQQVLEHIKEHRPTLFPGVPAIYAAINAAREVRSYGLSSIKACISGAAPLPLEVQETFEKLTRGRLVEGYGLTEASPVTHANPFGARGKVGSIGVPIPNTEARIVDLMTGAKLGPGQIGELAVRGPQVMQGYWGEEDGDTLRDGWLHTGDVAAVDGDGFFTIISRVRDTIMAGEYSVYPRDVEEVLYENSKVMEAAVVGVTAEGGGQRVKAFVVPRPGTELTKEELLAQCRRRLEPYQVPWEIEFRGELPKSFVGKVLRRMLVE
jgi:long-chain acyl-CoA synthetase